jgi:uncharacterized protein
MHWDYALILIFFALAVPWLGRRRIRQLLDAPEFSSVDRLRLYASTVAFQWIAAVVVLWRILAHHLSPADLGIALPRPGLALTTGAALSLLLLINQIVALRQLSRAADAKRAVLPRLAAKIFPRSASERCAYFAVVATVAICEEWVFRGFIQRILQDWSGGYVALGILGSAVLFGFAHLYQGRRGVATTGALGFVFSLVRTWTGSLFPTMAAHFAADLAVGLLAPRRLAMAEKAASKVSDGAAGAAAHTGSTREVNN